MTTPISPSTQIPGPQGVDPLYYRWLRNLSISSSGSFLISTNNLSDVASVPASLANLGITLSGNSFVVSGGGSLQFITTGATSLTLPTSGTLATTSQLPSLPLSVSNGGTGGSSFTAYSVICGGTSSTDPFQNVVGLGSSGNILTSNGAGALPTWQAPATSGTVTSITAGTGLTGGTITSTGTIALSVPVSATNGGTGVNNGSSTITLGGSFTTSGAFTTTLTVTGNTNVTLPTSGTLATTSQLPSLPLSVSDGGTGDSSLTAYAVLCGGTTSTAAVQSIAGVGTSGQVLTSNGAGALPTFQASAGGVTSAFNQATYQVFTTTGANTYTPNANMKYCWIRALGGGGAGGGTAASATQVGAGGGGGGGGYTEGIFTKATIIGAGTTAQITVGAGGTAGSAGNNPGNAGGNTTVIANGGAGSTLLTANGGSGGNGSATTSSGIVATGGAGGTASGGSVNITGGAGSDGFGGINATSDIIIAGAGGQAASLSSYGTLKFLATAVANTGITGANYGGGGGGAYMALTNTAKAGGPGAPGIVIVVEFLSV